MLRDHKDTFIMRINLSYNFFHLSLEQILVFDG